MSQTSSETHVIPGGPLPRIVHGTLTPEQRQLALQRVQNQSDKRTKLGFELFRATEAQTTRQQAAMDQLQAEHRQLTERLDGELADVRRELDDRQSTMDARLAKTTEALEQKVEALQRNWAGVELRISELLKHVANLTDGGKRHTQRPTPTPVTRTAAPSKQDHEQIVDNQIPTTAASMPQHTAAPNATAINPTKQTTPPPQPSGGVTERVYSQALEHLRSHRARPTDY